MAVMTTTMSSDGVVLDSPVPSSSEKIKMALDLDINGNTTTTKRDEEPTHDFEIPNPSLVIPDPPPSFVDSSEIIKSNQAAVAANNDRIMEENIVLPEDSIMLEENDAQPPSMEQEQHQVSPTEEEEIITSTSTTTTTTFAQTTTSDTSQQIDLSFDTVATTTVPPLIESQQSDLRESTTLPVSESEAAEIHAQKHKMDLSADPELANGLANTTDNEIIEREQSNNNTNNNRVSNIESAAPKNTNSLGDSATMAETAVTQSNGVDAIHSMNATSEGESQKTHNIESLQIDAPASQFAEQQQQDQHTEAAMSTEGDNTKPDVDMDDLFGEPAGESAPQSSGTKVAREREEDVDMDAPDAKRVKVDNDVNGHVIGEQEEDQEQDDPQGWNRPMTDELKKLIKTSLQSAKKGKVSEGFRKSVAESYPHLAEAYRTKIPNPIDLSIIEKKLTDNLYQTVGEYKADIDLIHANCVLFNPPDTPYPGLSYNLQQYLTNRIPIPGYVAPGPKSKKGSQKSTPIRDVAPRRPSRAANHTSPTAPKVKAETFPLDPVSQTPVIRRDSTLNNDRPKREIHPPKSKDIFTQAAPKTNRKKNALEMRFADHILKDIMKPRNYAMNEPFMIPVDPIAQNIPTYPKIIKQPMDLSTIAQKVNNGSYVNFAAFEADFRLMLKNCFTFNAEDNIYHQKGKDMEKYFANELKNKSRWLTANGHSRETQLSHDSEDDHSEDQDDLEDEAPASDQVEDRTPLQERLDREQQNLLEIINNKGTRQMIELQTNVIGMISGQLKALDERIAAAKKSGGNSKKTKASAKSTKRAPPPPPPKKTKKSSKAPRYISHREKEIISQGIGQLAEKEMQMVISWIRNDVPGLDEVEDNEMELDIDAVSEACLCRLYDLVLKHVPDILNTYVPAAGEDSARPAAQPASKPKKKNKPMGKSEQESKIAQLKQVVAGGAAGGGGGDQRYDDGNAGGKVMPSIEHAEQESSGDEEDSESEED